VKLVSYVYRAKNLLSIDSRPKSVRWALSQWSCTASCYISGSTRTSLVWCIWTESEPEPADSAAKVLRTLLLPGNNPHAQWSCEYSIEFSFSINQSFSQSCIFRVGL